MLTVTITGDEVWDEATETFSTVNDVVLVLEHSLVSLSKWEARHKIPFLSPGKSNEQIIDYLKDMVLEGDPNDINRCSAENLTEIQKYIDSTESATTFGEMPDRGGAREVITSELIYYWMVAFTIPWEAETWHLNRLFSLIRICNIKNSKERKMSRSEIAQRYRDLNAERRAKLGTSG